MAVGIGHAGYEDAVVVFGAGEAVEAVALFDALEGAVGGEVQDAVAQQLTVGEQKVWCREGARWCRCSVVHNMLRVGRGTR